MHSGALSSLEKPRLCPRAHASNPNGACALHRRASRTQLRAQFHARSSNAHVTGVLPAGERCGEDNITSPPLFAFLLEVVSGRGTVNAAVRRVLRRHVNPGTFEFSDRSPLIVCMSMARRSYASIIQEEILRDAISRTRIEPEVGRGRHARRRACQIGEGGGWAVCSRRPSPGAWPMR